MKSLIYKKRNKLFLLRKLVPVLLIILLLSQYTAPCQSMSPLIISSMGSFYNTGQYSICCTVGEVGIDTYFKSSNIMCLGFQQSDSMVFQTKVWSGLISSNWDVDENWNPLGTPFLYDNVFIPGNVPFQPIVNSQGYGCHNIVISNGAKFKVNQNFTFITTGTVTVKQ